MSKAFTYAQMIRICENLPICISLFVFVNLFHLLSLTLPAHFVNLFFYKP